MSYLIRLALQAIANVQLKRTAQGTLVAKLHHPSKKEEISVELSSFQHAPSDSELLDGNFQYVMDSLKEMDEYQLFLEISPEYRIPLHHLHRIKGQEDVEEDVFSARTILVPILPRMYANTNLLFDENEGLITPTTGFIYLFIDGFLWREIYLEDQSTEDNESDQYSLAEVNLDEDWGKSYRTSRITLKSDNILIPQIIDGKPVEEVQIAHSRVQWSWSQLQSFGGFHPEDPRVKGREQKAIKYSNPNDVRSKRMQPLKNMIYWTDLNPLTHLIHKDANHPDRGLPKVPLFNPLEFAVALAGEYMAVFKHLSQLHVELPDKNSHHISGEMLYRLVFDPTLYKHANGSFDYEGKYQEIKEQFGGRFPHLYQYREYLEKKYPNHAKSTIINEEIEDFLNVRRAYGTVFGPNYEKFDQGSSYIRGLADHIDMSLLEECLFPKDIMDTLELLDVLRQRYFDWLNEKVKGISYKTKLKSNYISLHSTLADYANLDLHSKTDEFDSSWLLTYRVFLMLLEPVYAKKTAVSDIYAHPHRLSKDVDDKPDPGDLWVEKILDDMSNPISQMLLPSDIVFDPNKPMMPAGVEEEDDFDGSGKFRPKAFASMMKQFIKQGEAQNLDQSVAQNNDSVSTTQVGGEIVEGEDAYQSASSNLLSVEQRQLALGVSIVEDFFGWLGRMLDPKSESYIKSEKSVDVFVKYQKRFENYVRYGQAMQLDEFAGLHLTYTDGVDLDKYTIVGADIEEILERHQDRIKDQKARHKLFVSEVGGTNKYISIKDIEGNVHGSSLYTQMLPLTINGKRITPEKGPSKSLSRKPNVKNMGTDLAKARVKVVVVDAEARKKFLTNMALAYEGGNSSKVASLSSHSALGGSRLGHTLMMSLNYYFEWTTLLTINEAMANRGGLVKYSATVAALTSLVSATGETNCFNCKSFWKKRIFKYFKGIIILFL